MVTVPMLTKSVMMTVPMLTKSAVVTVPMLTKSAMVTVPMLTKSAMVTVPMLTKSVVMTVQAALAKAQPAAKREGFATVPTTTWADVGALHDVRAQLEDSILVSAA